MNFNIEKIMEIYGDSTADLISENVDDIVDNLMYLKKLEFDDIEDIFERYVFIFVEDPKTFRKKVNKLISRLGEGYVSVLEENMNMWEEML